MQTTTFDVTTLAKKKALVDLLLGKADLTVNEIVDSAFTQWIRSNLDLLTDEEFELYKPYLNTKKRPQAFGI